MRKSEVYEFVVGHARFIGEDNERVMLYGIHSVGIPAGGLRTLRGTLRKYKNCRVRIEILPVEDS